MSSHEPQYLTKRGGLALAALFLLTAGAALAIVPPEGASPLAARAFRHPDLYISSVYRQVGQVPEPLASVLRQDLQALGAAESSGYVDLRTGSWGTLLLRQPLIPGSGKGNALAWDRRPPADDEALERAAWDAFQSYLAANQAALNVAPGELGQRTVTAGAGGRLIQINVRQSAAGVPVRGSFLTAVLNHGNLVLFGTRNWGAVAVATQPAVPQQAAVSAAEAHAGRVFPDYWSAPHLEIVPMAQGRDASSVPVGQGLRHRLVWAMGPRFADDHGTWEALVDAHSGEVIAFTDRNEYLKSTRGGVFPVSNDGIGPEGTEQPGQPMPYVDLTDAAGQLLFGDGGGDLQCTAHTPPLRTRLSGRFVSISDRCGAIDEPENFPGGIDLGAGPGTDCAVPPGHSAGDTHSSRTGFYEVNRIIEQAKGWLPDNAWLNSQLTANMNINNTCNAFWNGSTINFYRSGPSQTNPTRLCRNTGEIAAVFDHEWGHGLDNNDANPSISAPGEAYADVAAIVRLNTSCIGRGFSATNTPCSGSGDPCTECTGVREVDWTKRQSGVPHNIDWINEDPLDPNGIRGGCRVSGAGSTSFGPCGFGTHCEGSAASEGVWDLLVRDLPAFGDAGFAIDANTALEMVTRYYYTAGGVIGNWYNCNPASLGGPGTYGDGCNADGVYMNFLAVDDDNGDLTDGTPHMSALFAAWDRHQMACPTLPVADAGCAGRPVAAPVVTASPLFKGARLSWAPVPGATRYWIYRTEGALGCAFGKTRIAETAGTEFLDAGLQNGREYSYGVIPVGAADSCMGPMSACATVVPGGAVGTLAFTGRRPQMVSGGDGDSAIDNCETGTAGVEVENRGDAPLTNVRVTRVEAVSHPGIAILGTSAPLASLSPCATGEGSFQFQAAGIGDGERVVFRVHFTADELAPAEITRTAEFAAAESDFLPVASRTWSFAADREGWGVVTGTFEHDPGLGANLGNGFLKSSSLLDGQCDEIESPIVRLTAGSTLSLFNQFSIEPGTAISGFFDRANVALRNKLTGERTAVSPDGGRLYDASGPGGTCVTNGQPGWAGLGPAFLESTWSAGALNPGGAATGEVVTLDIAYGTDGGVALTGFQFDEITLTDFEERVPDAQPDICRACNAVDDSDRSVGYRSGWHRVVDPAASGGGYHRRMGTKAGGGANPAVRVVFAGDQITYFFARSSAGGAADVYIDGVFRETVSYFAASLAPTFGHSATYGGLGAGSHELRIEHRSGAVYVDGFEFCSGGGADASAVQHRSATEASTGTLGAAALTRTVQVGAGDEEVSVVVEGMAAPLTVQLLDPLGNAIASSGALVPGFAASGLDKAVPAPGTYTVKVINTLGLAGGVKISIARTVRVQ